MPVPTVTRRYDDVPIFQGDDAERIEETRAHLNRAMVTAASPRAPRPLRVGDEVDDGRDQLVAAAKALDELVAECLPRAVIVRVQALGRRTWRALLLDYPPRPGNERDEELGYDQDAMAQAVLAYRDDATGEHTIAHVRLGEQDEDAGERFGSKAEVEEWLDELNDGNFTQLAVAAIDVNEGGSPDPKASFASQVARVFGVTSRSPDTTE